MYMYMSGISLKKKYMYIYIHNGSGVLAPVHPMPSAVEPSFRWTGPLPPVYIYIHVAPILLIQEMAHGVTARMKKGKIENRMKNGNSVNEKPTILTCWKP